MKVREFNQDLLQRLDKITHKLDIVSKSLAFYNECEKSQIVCAKCGINCPEKKRVKYYCKGKKVTPEWRCVSCSLFKRKINYERKR